MKNERYNENKRYKGWANYPTYAVNQWLINDPEAYSNFIEEVEAVRESTDLNLDVDEKVYDLSCDIYDYVK